MSANSNSSTAKVVRKQGPHTIDDLSDKLLYEVFTHLDYESFLAASQVQQRWNRIVAENIDFFSSYFIGDDEEKDADGKEEEAISEEQKKKSELEEQQAIVDSINQIPSNQYHEILGVSVGAEEDEIKLQYKKLALLLHPDKNKADGAMKAFQTLKKAYDIVLSSFNGIDPNEKDTRQIDCPSVGCGTIIYVTGQQYSDIMKGSDIGFCRGCKNKFGRMFCPHCFTSWIVPIKQEQEGMISKCTSCSKQFAILYPKPVNRKVRPLPEVKTKQPVKKQKNWWQ